MTQPSPSSRGPLADALDELFTGDALAQFQAEGFVVFKNALPEPCAAQYLDEMKHADSAQRFSPNKVEFLLSSGPIQLVKPAILECDLHDGATRADLPAFEQLFTGNGAAAVTRLINERFPEMDLKCVVSNNNNEHNEKHTKNSGGAAAAGSGGGMARHMTLKMQINSGGAFPCHIDNPGPPNMRKLTLALYLTKDWKQGDGGEIVLLPFLGKPVVVAPEFNTLVLFRSDVINHRVLNAAPGTTRFCFTIWFDSGSVNADEDVNLRAKHLHPDSIPMLRACSPLSRSLSRAVYDEEYRESLTDCFGATRDAMIALKMHEVHVKPLLQNPAVASFVAALRAQKTPALKEHCYGGRVKKVDC